MMPDQYSILADDFESLRSQTKHKTRIPSHSKKGKKQKPVEDTNSSKPPPPSIIQAFPSYPATSADIQCLVKQRQAQLKRGSFARSTSVFGHMPAEENFEEPLPSKCPDFSTIVQERGVKHSYDPVTQRWSRSPVRVRVDPFHFASGGMRRAHFLYMVGDIPSTSKVPPPLFVGKVLHEIIANTTAQFRTLYFQDVEQQMIARHYAAKYNRYGPVKIIDFLEAFLVELIDREQDDEMRLIGVERYISGNYKKWNNNYGYVHANTRNTPQAFSHFTWEASKHTILIVDIQGVGDMYTDPVLHTKDPEGSELFSGNLGMKGITQFLSSHQCNPLCKALGLPPINPLETDVGTVPDNPAYRAEISCEAVDVQSLTKAPLDEEGKPLLMQYNYDNDPDPCCCTLL